MLTGARTCGITCGGVGSRAVRVSFWFEADAVRDEFDAFGFQDGFDGLEGYGTGGTFFGAEDG
jgi:hypothetical protein